jgi:hypothetical protein
MAPAYQARRGRDGEPQNTSRAAAVASCASGRGGCTLPALDDPLPSVEHYLRDLPDGIDSYPDVAVKGSVLVSMLGHPGFAALSRHPGLPAPALGLIAHPPTATSWVPEVHFNVTMAGFYDVVFRDKGGFEPYEAWVVTQNMKLFSTALYRVLFAVMSPQRLLTSVSLRWGAFRRGTTLTLLHGGPGFAEVRLTYPRNLEPPTALYSFSGAFRAAARAAHGEVTSMTMTTELGVSTRWHLEWR